MVMAQPTCRPALRPVGPDVLSPGSVLNELGADYPDLHGPVIVDALGRAYEAALASGARVTPDWVTMLARDRLDVARERARLAARSAGRRYPLPANGSGGGGEGHGEVLCAYCGRPMAAASFVRWSAGGSLLSATCPTCLCQTTIRSSTWQRLSEPVPVAAQPAAAAGNHPG
jgi:hypothetical protein